MEQIGRKSIKGVNTKKKRRKHSVSDDLMDSFKYRGKISARKLTVFFSFVMLNVTALLSIFYQTTIHEVYLYIWAIIILIGLGFLTAENIVEMVRARFRNQNMFVDYDQENIFANRNRVDNPDQLPKENN